MAVLGVKAKLSVRELLSNKAKLLEWISSASFKSRKLQLMSALSNKENQLNEVFYLSSTKVPARLSEIDFPIMKGKNGHTIVIYHHSKIGAGSFGKVYLGYNLDSSELCVVKKHRINQPELLRIAENEIDKLEQTGQLVDWVQQGNKYVFFAQKLARGYDLFDFLVVGKNFRINPEINFKINSMELPLAYRIQMAISYFQALNEFHQKHKLVHRDLKLENIMWDPVQQKIKIIDLGLSERMQFNQQFPEGYVVDKYPMGTLAYIAPELLRRGNIIFSTKSDMYASAIIVGFILLGPAMINITTELGGFEKFINPELLRNALLKIPNLSNDFEDYTDKSIAMICRMLSADPILRPNSDALIIELAELMKVILPAYEHQQDISSESEYSNTFLFSYSTKLSNNKATSSIQAASSSASNSPSSTDVNKGMLRKYS